MLYILELENSIMSLIRVVMHSMKFEFKVDNRFVAIRIETNSWDFNSCIFNQNHVILKSFCYHL